MTYSIVARDAETGCFGVAVQTHNLAVGAWVPWAEGGVGAVATQAMTERSYGPLGLALMRRGKSAGEALAALLAVDQQRHLRQISMLDGQGNVASHTGTCCLPAAGCFQGEHFCTQGNMVAQDGVWLAMAEAYQTAAGPFADRLMAALDAAQAAGGDVRGKQTAALLVVDGCPNPVPLVNLRVDHHPHPLVELRRLLGLHRAYETEARIVRYIDAHEYDAAYELICKLGDMAPGEPYLQCLRAVHLDRSLGRRDEARAILQRLLQDHPGWWEYLQREVRNRHAPCLGLDAELLRPLEPSRSGRPIRRKPDDHLQ